MEVPVNTKPYTLIDGKKISSDIKAEIMQKVAERKQSNKKIPHLAIILVGWSQPDLR
jgi:methylenetetrahydrofolate dehydrogenase (NADP+)/methenyltetrahydrofolate cyclohydrolase